MKGLVFSSFNNDNQSVRYYETLNDTDFIFTVRWNSYADCAFLSIYDDDSNPIITGRALVNGLAIRNHNLPYVMFFGQIEGEKYEPTIDNIATEFALFYDDGSEVV